jgi:hypothetical protein
MKTMQVPNYAGESRLAFGFFDDFEWLISPHRWTSLVADAGATLTVSSLRSGKFSLLTGAVLNNEGAVFTTNKNFLFADDAPMIYEGYIQFSEAATNFANVCAGFSSAFGADLLLDSGAGPATSQSAALIYKVSGETTWRFVTSLGAVQTISRSTATAGGAGFQRLTVEVNAISGTQVECVPKVNGEQLLALTTLAPIKHMITFSGAAQMGCGVYVKAGSGSAETLVTDYISAWQKR